MNINDMNDLEGFLYSSQTKIDDLEVTFEPNYEDYKYLVIKFEKNTYKIEHDFVINFCNIYRKINKEEMEEVEVDPFKNLGSIKEKSLEIDSSLLTTEEEVYELLEKIVEKIYEKYNFLILPPSDEEIEEIKINDYVADNYEVIRTQEKSQGQNLYSIGFKIKISNDKETEYFPLKIYFRMFNNNGEVGIQIADEFNSMSPKASKNNVMTTRKFNNRDKAELKRRFDNHEFDADKELISENIEKIIIKVLAQIAKFVDNFDKDPDEPEATPKWFKESELGTYINTLKVSTSKEPIINATASFRYITQTPLPYSYLTIRMKNRFNQETYQIKKSSSKDKELNNLINTCPICSEPINENNKLVTSNEYEQGIIGCQKCMTMKCSLCSSKWSEKKLPKFIGKTISGKYYYQAGTCNSSICLGKECSGDNLCSTHSRKCFDPSCEGSIYCEKVVERCSNIECNHTYCLNHAKSKLYKCETTICANSQFPNKYCGDCKDSYLNTCHFCGKTMCQNCSKPVLTQDKGSKFVVSDTEYICIDCFNNISNPSNKELNLKNQVLVYDRESSEYLPKSMEYLYPYSNQKNVFIDREIAELAYERSKPENWESDSSAGKYYYRKEETHKCDYCGELFRLTRPSSTDKNSHYCDDCLVNCSICSSLVVIDDVISYQKSKYCKNCYGDLWQFSDLTMDNESLPGEKNDLAEQIFANISLLKRYKLVPVPNDKLFVCPETKYVLSEEQTKVCKSCNQRYSSSLFEESSNVCLLCQKLNSVEYIENSQYLKKAFYERKYGPKEDFKAYCTMNTLMLKYNHSNGSQLDIFHFNTKKGKYVLVKDLQKEAK